MKIGEIKHWKIIEREFDFTWLIGGFVFFPYQCALGFSFRIWSTGPAIRLYCGPFKFWCGFILW